MSFRLEVPNEYGFVILASVSTYIMNIIHSVNTGHFRKLSKIGYPAAYASPEQVKDNQNAFLFNCAQRSHAQFTENHVSVLVPMLITGLKYPITSAALGFLWTISRYFYMTGYCSTAKPDGRGRYNGSAYYVSQAGFLGLSIWMGVEMLMKKYM